MELPENFKIGQAVGNGDCFFDSIAQGINQIMPELNVTVKVLRKICKDLAVYDDTIKDKVVTDAENVDGTNNNIIDPSIVSADTQISRDDLWSAYLASIEYTSEDDHPELYRSLTSSRWGSTLQVPIWGRPDIEGKLICRKYNIKLHVVEQLPNKIYLNQVVDESGSKSVDGVDYNEENLVHIINKDRGHFEPILRKCYRIDKENDQISPEDKEEVNEELKKDYDKYFSITLYSEDGEHLLGPDEFQDLMKTIINEIKSRVTKNITLEHYSSEDEAKNAINACYNLAPSTSDFWNDDDRKYFDENSITIESKGNGTFYFILNNVEHVLGCGPVWQPIITLNLNNAFEISDEKSINSEDSSDIDKNDTKEGYKLELRNDSFSQNFHLRILHVPKKFLNLMNNLPKFKEVYEKLTNLDKQLLYTNATLDNSNQQCIKLSRIISELSVNDTKMERVIDAISLLNDIIKETSVSGKIRDPETITSYNDICAEINGVLEWIEAYKNVKSRKEANGETNVVLQLAPVWFYCISQRIQRLKLQLKMEPLDKLRFLLINFIELKHKNNEIFIPFVALPRHLLMFAQSGTDFNDLNEKEFDFFERRHVDVLVESVYELGDKLTVIKRELEKDESVSKKINSSSNKLKKIGERIKNEKGFELVRKYYYVFRDVYSLKKIMDYIDVVKSVDLKEDGIMGKLIIQRALQAIGELLKNSESSPHLSENTRDYLKKCNVPVKELEKLRNKLSHCFKGKCKRISIEEIDDDIFVTIQDEIETFRSSVKDVLNIIKQKRTLLQLDEAHYYLTEVLKEDEFSLLASKIGDKKKYTENLLVAKCEKLKKKPNKDRYNGKIKVFSEKIIEEMPNCKLSVVFKTRLEALLNILDSNYVKSRVRKRCSILDDSSYNYPLLLPYYLNEDKMLLLAIEMLLLDLTTILTDMKLFLKGFVLQDVLLSLLSYDNASTRNYLGHMDLLLSSNSLSRGFLIAEPILFFKKFKQEILSLVNLYLMIMK